MSQLFTLHGTVKRDPAIDAWFRDRPGELGAIAQQWFERMRQAGPEVREVLHDGCPTACVDEAAFAYVNVYKAHVNVGFFRGAELADPAGLLEGAGKMMRHVKLRPSEAVDENALVAMIETAYSRLRERVLGE